MICTISLQFVVVSFARQRVIENFVEPFADKLLAYNILQLLTYIINALCRERRLQTGGNLYVIVSVHSQDILNHIARTLYIHAICRHTQGEPLLVFRNDLHVQGRQNGANQVVGDFLPDQFMYILIFEFNVEAFLQFRRLHVDNLHGNFPTGQLLGQQCSLLQRVKLPVGIHSTLETERSISAQSVTARALAHPSGMEIGTFKQDITRRVVRPASLSSEHAGNTHRLFGITNEEVAIRKLAFLPV